MKKLFALVLALAMVLALAACGGNGGGNDFTIRRKRGESNALRAVVMKLLGSFPVKYLLRKFFQCRRLTFPEKTCKI